jgi:DNA-binding NarL/FixJ family response regulator
MSGGTLLISRAVNNHAYYRKRLHALGFYNVTVTDAEKNALYLLIREIKPSLILMSARFYHCCTPFLMGELHKTFPKIRMAAISLGEYPPDIAMYFIMNGITSYVSSFDGVEQFYKGIDEIVKGRDYISPQVLKQIELRRTEIQPAGILTERLKQVLRLVCCGFKDNEIADVLSISRNTVLNHKTNIFTSLNVRSPLELLRAALTIKIVSLEELYFYPKDYTVNPLPEEKIKRRKRNDY